MFRLRPPLWLFGREATRDTAVGRWRVEKGEQVLITPWLMHRDRRWFADPEAFRSERWTPAFEDGLPRKSEYRRFAIRGLGSSGAGTVEGGIEGGDVQWIHEAVRRRMARYLDERIDTGEEADDAQDEDGDPAAVPQRPSPVDPETGRPRKFAYPPNLLVVDGGAARH